MGDSGEVGDSGPDVEQVKHHACLRDDQMRLQTHRLQGLVRKRWLDDATRIKNGSLQEPLSNAEMKAAAIQWVVHAANHEKISFGLNDWKIRDHAEEKQFLLLCANDECNNAFYAWYFNFSLLYAQ